MHDSGVDRFRRQFAHLEEGTAKGEKPSPQLRQNVSLPRFSSKLTLSFPKPCNIFESIACGSYFSIIFWPSLVVHLSFFFWKFLRSQGGSIGLFM